MMDCRIYDPTVTSQTVWDPYTDPSGLTYFAMASIATFGDRLFFAVAANDGGAEGAAGQAIWMKTSDDGGATWSEAFQPFGDSDYCTNPITEPGWSTQWQPCFVRVGTELWCQWFDTAFHYLSKLTAPEGKWTTQRFMFDSSNNYKPILTDDLTSYGLQDDGLTTFPIFDGSECSAASSADGLVLSDGRVALPVTFTSDAYTTTPDIASSFTRHIKYNGVLFGDGDNNWTLTRIDTSLFGDFTAWEPVVFEDPGGNIFVLSRNLNMSGTDDDMFLVASSTDGGQTFTPSVSAKLRVPSARIGVKQVGRRRWVMTTCDSRVHSTRAIEQNSVNARKNVALFMSRRGVPDFGPGINISGDDVYTNYPQACVDGEDLLVAFNVGLGGSGNAPTVMKLVRVSPLPDDQYAWIHPRSNARIDPPSPVDPAYVDSSPDYLNFVGNNKVVSTTAVTATTGLTYSAWVLWTTTDCDSVIDARYTGGGTPFSNSFGQSFARTGLFLAGMSFLHGETLASGVPTFLSASIDNTAQTITLYTAQGGANFTTKTCYYKSILFSGLPSDGETVTINGTTYTFRASASLANEVTIGATLADLGTNLSTKLRANAMQAGDVGDGRVLLARTDYAAFSVTSGSAVLSVESGMPLNASHATIGYKNISGSSQRPWFGRIYEGRVYSSALSIANMRSLYNRLASSLGYSSITGTSTTPGTPLLFLDASSRDLTEFPLVGSAPDYDIDGAILTLNGETSAFCELPYGANQLTIKFKFGAEPVSAERYVIAAFGDGDTPARLYIDGAHPHDLYLQDRYIDTVTPTDWNTVTVIVSTNKVSINGTEYFFTGKPRCFLGNAYPQGLLASTKATQFDASAMSVNRA